MAKRRKDDEEDVLDDEEEDYDEEEDEDEEEQERPKKKKKRKQGASRFLDVEAAESEHEEDDDDDQDNDDADGFIVDDDDNVGGVDPTEALAKPPPRRRQFADEDETNLADLAAQYDQRDRQRRTEMKNAEQMRLNNVLPRNALMPSVDDPPLFAVRCKAGKERSLVESLHMKCFHDKSLRVDSVFYRDSLKGFIYVEAFSESDVRAAAHGILGIYLNTPRNSTTPSAISGIPGVHLVPLSERPDLLRTKKVTIDLVKDTWVRIRRGKYVGDLAQVVDTPDNPDDVRIKLIPRIDMEINNKEKDADGNNKKKSSRAPQRFFNVQDVRRVYGSKAVARQGGYYIFQNEDYRSGYLYKDVKSATLTVDNVDPSLDEITHFTGESGKEDNSSTLSERNNNNSLAKLADAAKRSQITLQEGDHVSIVQGDQKGLHGHVESVQNDIVTLIPDHTDFAELARSGTKVEVSAKFVAKRFKQGDHIKVISGVNSGDSGLVINVSTSSSSANSEETLEFFSDVSQKQIKVFTKDVREAAEAGIGAASIDNYELHDLVQLDQKNFGVIFKLDKELFKIVDADGIVRSIKPSQISQKLDTRFSIAMDHDGFELKPGEMVKEVLNTGSSRTGRVLHVYRAMYAFLYDRENTHENGGIFVTNPSNLQSLAPKSVSSSLPDPSKMNPATKMGMGMMGPGGPNGVGMAMGISTRRDPNLNQKVTVIRGQFKGSRGIIKDVNNNLCRVELIATHKVISIEKNKLGVIEEDGNNIISLDQFNQLRITGGPGGRGGYRNPYSARPSPAPGGDSWGAPPGDRWSGVGEGSGGFRGRGRGRGFGRGRGGFNGGRGGYNPSPSPGWGATGSSGWDDNSSNNGWGGTGASNNSTNSNPGWGTPYGAGSSGGDSWGDSGGGRTTYGGAGAQTPYGAGGDSSGWGSGFGGSAGASTPAWGGVGARTPAYGGRSTYGSSHTPAHRSNNNDNNDWDLAPTPGFSSSNKDNSGGVNEGWGGSSNGRNGGVVDSAPTPAAGGGGWGDAAPTPAGGGWGDAAPTPAGGGWGDAAPTPAARTGGGAWDDDDNNNTISSSSRGGWADMAPTPGASLSSSRDTAPTPYLSAPTPGAGLSVAPTPGPYRGAPTPGPPRISAPTPAAYAPTPGAYLSRPTPGGPGTGGGRLGTIAGTPAAAASPWDMGGSSHHHKQVPNQRSSSAAKYNRMLNWQKAGLCVVIASSSSSPYENGKYDDEHGVIVSSDAGAEECDIKLESGTLLSGVHYNFIEPLPPSDPDQNVRVIGGDEQNVGKKCMTRSRDEGSWLVVVVSSEDDEEGEDDSGGGGLVVIDSHLLCVIA